jgi:RNA polymerase sigma-70 factor, ECF subfamily
MMLSHAQSEDISQETMLKILRSLDQFRRSSSFRAWSYTILTNAIRDELRRHQRRSFSGDSEAVLMSAIDTRSVEGPSVVQQECHQSIDQAMSRLSESQRSAVVLLVLEGLSAREVADIEGCSIDAVYQRVSEAKRKLRSDVKLRALWVEKG